MRILQETFVEGTVKIVEKDYRVTEKRPYAALPSSCPVSSTGQACYGVLPSTPHSSGFRLPAPSRFGEGRGAWHLAILEQPEKEDFFSVLLLIEILDESHFPNNSSTKLSL